jgi:parallel beta-helix repeat protein
MEESNMQNGSFRRRTMSGARGGQGAIAALLLTAAFIMPALIAPFGSDLGGQGATAGGPGDPLGAAAVMDPGGIPHYFGPYANYANSPVPTGPVTDIIMIDGGSKYTNPTVTIADAWGTGAGATAKATVVGGVITQIVTVNVGAGYSAPVVVIDDITGSGAAAEARIGGVLSGGIRKFVDSLPGLTAGNANNLGAYIPIAVADTTSFPGSQYYEIALVQYVQKMHSDLPPTLMRGYVQLETPAVAAQGKHVALKNPDGSAILMPDGTQAFAMDDPRYLGPVIISVRDAATRVTFYNLLPTGAGGDLFLPVDTSVMGAGMGPLDIVGQPGMKESYTENRATLHLHGGLTPWISDGTPHQWITPASEATQYPKGVSVAYVPDMWFVNGDIVADTVGQTDPPSAGATNNPGPGAQTFYYTNQQSARLMFYHDHAQGITRLNVYAGEAAGYLLVDQTEMDLIDAGLLPNAGGVYTFGIPLIIQDRTFVDASTIASQDPTWKWGSTPPVPHTGDLWYPHVYMPNQNPWSAGGMNDFGRWHYGPWFWPPTLGITNPPAANPYYDPVNAPWEPPMMPATPNPSAPAEAFMDTPIVNGVAYPYVTVEPQAYRFRILNAADDRFFNLQLYVADPDTVSTDGRMNTEVRMIDAVAAPGVPATWPADGRAGGAPDPAMAGPDFIQIGTEGGFLPAPVVVPNQPVTWNLDPTTFAMGNVQDHTLLLGCAERADVIIDFSKYAGKTLILYNDAPAAFPALDPRYDYYTGHEDLTGAGGAPTTYTGFGPNTRTIMQIRVADIAPAPAYDVAALEAAWASTPAHPGVFESSQDPILVPQAGYASAYDLDLTDTVSRIMDKSLTFKTIAGDTVTVPFESKSLQDEQGETFDLEYGRQGSFLGLVVTGAVPGGQSFITYPYSAPPVELLEDCTIVSTPVAGDGTQIWKITHQGVDTHPIHFHLFNVQLINRVAWDNALYMPDPNELGWKETVRVNPLTDTIVALRPVAPSLPWELPNIIRPIDPNYPLGTILPGPPPLGWMDPNAEPIVVTNKDINFGWEYVYHCHILAHEEMDMMHAMVFATAPRAPSGLTAGMTGATVNLQWTDNSIAETGFIVQRRSGAAAWADLAAVTSVATGPTKGNIITYDDNTAAAATKYAYRVLANNLVGDTTDYGNGNPFPTADPRSSPSNTVVVDTGGGGDLLPPPGPPATPPPVPWPPLPDPPVPAPPALPAGVPGAHHPIRIDSNAGFTAANGVSGGSGTAGDPWIIEGLDISGAGSSFGIYIGNTTDFFEVRNCNLHDAAGFGTCDLPFYPDAGLVFYDVQNGEARNNRLSGNGWAGIAVYDSRNILIDGNTVTGSYMGIYLDGVRDSTVSQNTLSGDHAGTWLYRSRDNTLSDNILMKNFRGMVLAGSDGNTVYHNEFLQNADFGVQMFSGSSGNTVTYNAIALNGNGAFLEGSSGNDVHHNNFKDNGAQAYDSGQNDWDTGNQGNFWSDYTGPDANGNGIGDLPYTSATGQGIGGGTMQDDRPLMKPLDSWPPIAIVDAPAPYWRNANPRTITVTATDLLSSVASCTLRYRSSADNLTFSAWANFGTLNVAPWLFSFTFPQGQGYYEFEAVATDTQGNVDPTKGLAEARAGHDLTPPQSSVDAISPSTYNYWQTYQPLWITVTASSAYNNLDGVTLYFGWSPDNIHWPALGAYTAFATLRSAPWQFRFTFPSGLGYYRFYSIATTQAGNTKAAPATYDTLAINVGSLVLGIKSPADNQFVSGMRTIQVQATGSVSIGPVYIALVNIDSATGIFNVSAVYNAATGFYEYTYDTAATVDGNYSVAAFATDFLGTMAQAAPVVFRIENTPLTVTVVTPAPGSFISGTVVFSAHATTVFPDHMEYSLDNGTWAPIATPFDTTATWDGTHYFSVRAFTQSGLSTRFNFHAVVDNVAPSCRIDNPGNTQFVSGTATFKVSAQDANGVGGAVLNVTNSDSGATAFNLSLTYNPASGFWELPRDTTLDADGNYTAAAWSTDLAGKTTASDAIGFRLDNNAPSVTVSGPVKGAYLSGSLTIAAAVTDTFLDRSEYKVDAGGWVAIATALDTTAYADGNHTLTVRALDLASHSTTVDIPVIIDNTAPTCRIDGPTAGQYASGTASFRVSATDAVGFGTVHIAVTDTDTASEVLNRTVVFDLGAGYFAYSQDTTTWADGNYSAVAWAQDASGKTTWSAPVSFHVDNTAPVLTVTGPVTGDYVKGSVSIAAAATDVFLDRIEYRVDAGGWVGIATAWNTLLAADGRHNLTVRALDLAGRSDSTIVAVTVDNNVPVCRIDRPVDTQFASGTWTFQVYAWDAVGIGSVLLNVTNADTGAAMFNLTLTWNGGSGLWEISRDTTLWKDGNYTASAWSTDLSSKMTPSARVSFRVDNNAPVLVVSSPASGDYVLDNVTIATTVTDAFPHKTEYRVDSGGWTDIATAWNTRSYRDGSHDVWVRATDLAGRYSTVNLSVFVDNTAPTCRIDSPWEGQFFAMASTFRVSATDTVGIGAVYLKLVKTDTQATVFNKSLSYDSASGYFALGYDTTLTADGNYTASASVMDRSGKWAYATPVAFHIDNTAPVLVVSSPKAGDYIQNSFTLSTAVTELFYDRTEYRIDSGPWTAIAATWHTVGYADGPHNLSVRAWDLSGKSDTVDLVVIVDNTFPAVAINSPAFSQFAEGELVYQVLATDHNGISKVFANLTNVDTGLSVSNYSLVFNAGSGLWEIPKDSRLLPDGNYSLLAWGTDKSGKTTEAGPVKFQIDNHAPSLLVAYPASGAYIMGDVALQAAVLDAFPERTEYRIDSGGWAGIGVPWSTVMYADGPHALSVRAWDQSGKSTTVDFNVIVDNNAPTCEIASPIPGQFASGMLALQASSADTVGISRVYIRLRSLDGAGTDLNRSATFGASTGYYAVSVDTGLLTDGNYTVSAWSTDLSGKTTEAPAVAFRVDNHAPALSLVGPAPGSYLSGFVLMDAPASDTFLDSVSYSVDGGPWADIDVPWNTHVVPDGVHSIAVRAMDLSGKTSTASVTVIADNNAPACRIDAPSPGQFLSGQAVFRVSATDQVGVARAGVIVTSQDSGAEAVNATLTFNPGTGLWELLRDSATLPDGNYSLTAWATDMSAKTTVSVAVAFQVDNALPVLVIQDPVKGAYLRGSVSILALASDTFLERTQYMVDGGSWIATATPWDTRTAVDGPHTLTVRALDRSGKTETRTLTVTVDNSVPAIMFTGPNPANKVNNVTTVRLSVDAGQGLKYVRAGSEGAERELVMGTDGLYSVEIDTRALGIVEGTLTVTAHSENLAGTVSNATLVLTVDNKAPEIKIRSVRSGQAVLRATFVNAEGMKDAWYRIDGGRWRQMNLEDATTFSARWDTTALKNGDHSIEVMATDALGNAAQQTFTVTVDNPPDLMPYYLALLLIVVVVAAVAGYAMYRRRGKAALSPPTAKPVIEAEPVEPDPEVEEEGGEPEDEEDDEDEK